jgi:hypothetical protein
MDKESMLFPHVERSRFADQRGLTAERATNDRTYTMRVMFTRHCLGLVGDTSPWNPRE